MTSTLLLSIWIGILCGSYVCWTVSSFLMVPNSDPVNRKIKNYYNLKGRQFSIAKNLNSRLLFENDIERLSQCKSSVLSNGIYKILGREKTMKTHLFARRKKKANDEDDDDGLMDDDLIEDDEENDFNENSNDDDEELFIDEIDDVEDSSENEDSPTDEGEEEEDDDDDDEILEDDDDDEDEDEAEVEEEEEQEEEQIEKPKKKRATRKRKTKNVDYTVNMEDNPIRGSLVIVTSGDPNDMEMIKPFIEKVLVAHGDKIEVLHRTFPVEEEESDLLEMWFECYDIIHLHSRREAQKRGRSGNINTKIENEMFDLISNALHEDELGHHGPF